MSDNSSRPSVGFLILWHALVAGLIAVIADLRVSGVGFWSNTREEFLAGSYVLGAYLVVALVSIVAAARGKPLRLATIIATTLSIFGLAFLGLLMLAPEPPYSRALLLSLLIIAFALVPGSALPASARRWIPVVLALGFLAVAGLDAYRTFGPKKLPAMKHGTKSVATALYTVQLETYENPVPKSAVRGGAIAPVGDQYLLASGDGHLYLFAWPAGGKFVQPKLLPYRVPYNPDDFILDSHSHWTESDANSARADAMKGVQVWQFRVADILVKENGDKLQVFASHHYWNRQDKCFTARVSMLEIERRALLAGEPAGPWKTIFEATPCLPLEGPDSLHSNNPFGGMEIGGRMRLLGPDELLLTVGDHDFSGVESKHMLAQEPEALYGKTILIHLADGSHEVYTSGHRNPQGLFIDNTGTVWETEHGPQGGDELNILTKGTNYGWPLVTYGTDYGSSAWPLNKHQGRHEGFQPPAYAWVPSIGVSNLIRLQGEAFPNWKDDLLVSSLHGKTIYRVRLEGHTVVYAEPIAVGDRLRDIVEGPDGQILMWTDTYNLISLHPAAGTSGAVLFGTRCGGCHKIDAGTNNSYGPDLFKIVGKNAGANKSFDGYSPAMKAFGKTWTPERLDQFLTNPQAVVPGTIMSFEGLKDAKEREAIVHFLAGSD
jgi:cytochrome c2